MGTSADRREEGGVSARRSQDQTSGPSILESVSTVETRHRGQGERNPRLEINAATSHGEIAVGVLQLRRYTVSRPVDTELRAANDESLTIDDTSNRRDTGGCPYFWHVQRPVGGHALPRPTYVALAVLNDTRPFEPGIPDRRDASRRATDTVGRAPAQAGRDSAPAQQHREQP